MWCFVAFQQQQLYCKKDQRGWGVAGTVPRSRRDPLSPFDARDRALLLITLGEKKARWQFLAQIKTEAQIIKRKQTFFQSINLEKSPLHFPSQFFFFFLYWINFNAWALIAEDGAGAQRCQLRSLAHHAGVWSPLFLSPSHFFPHVNLYRALKEVALTA